MNEKKKYSETPVIWKPVAGHAEYEVSNYGEVARKLKHGRREIAQVRKTLPNGSDYMAVRFTENSRRTEAKTARVVFRAFCGEIPDGFCVVHHNGATCDNRAWNLKLMKKSEIGKAYGGRSRCMAVEKVAPDGTVVDLFRSAREAGRHEHMSFQTILDRCNGRVKKAYALNGFTYRWEE